MLADINSARVMERDGRQAGNGPRMVAVIAMQGDYAKHMATLEALGVRAIAARTVEEVEAADAVIIPGGESTTIGKLLARYGVDDAIKRAAAAGKPVWGTCAGMILLAREIETGTGERGGQPTLGLLDITVARNAFGRQIDSFEADLDAPEFGPAPLHAVFIRAPVVVSAGPAVKTIATYEGRTVFVRQGSVLGSSFHPELTGDNRVHQFFVSLIEKG